MPVRNKSIRLFYHFYKLIILFSVIKKWQVRVVCYFYAQLIDYIVLNNQKWQEKKDEETRKQMAENGRFKAFRRHMKNHGPGRITFDDS